MKNIDINFNAKISIDDLSIGEVNDYKKKGFNLVNSLAALPDLTRRILTVADRFL